MGTRLRPYTDTMPKPMVPLLGKPLIGYIFDHVVRAGIQNVVVNLHHKADILRAYFQKRSDVNIAESFEDELLETGGGTKKALPLLGQNPFFMINGDAFWVDPASSNMLTDMMNIYDEQKMDILLLLYPLSKMILTEGVGDYDIDENGRAIRNHDKQGQYMFAGVRLSHPRIFKNTPDGKFSFLKLMDNAETNGRLFAHVYAGEWHHISTPDDLKNVEQELLTRNVA
jgi:MurNAc alpha-1-phosphate uridylyltransferase